MTPSRSRMTSSSNVSSDGSSISFNQAEAEDAIGFITVADCPADQLLDLSLSDVAREDPEEKDPEQTCSVADIDDPESYDPDETCCVADIDELSNPESQSLSNPEAPVAEQQSHHDFEETCSVACIDELSNPKSRSAMSIEDPDDVEIEKINIKVIGKATTEPHCGYWVTC